MASGRRPLPLVALAATVPLALAAHALHGAAHRDASPASAAPPTVDEGVAAFAEVARVLRHPRCLNCHPMGDRPHVGDAGHEHAMNVQRGSDGHGRTGQRCHTCHQDANQELAQVPGAPHWHLALRSMGWVGLDNRDLAAALTDRAKNGDRSLADLREHMAEDPLVLWGWDPGPGRQAVPVSHEEFLGHLDTWIAAGAPAGLPGVVSTF
jgi:hypothetical protein